MVYSAVSDDVGTISQFTRRKKIKLSHSGSLTAYQKLLDNLAYESAMQADFDDIRFTTVAGVHIPHWIQEYTASTSADVWIKNDYVDGDTHIMMYYGNSSLSSGSSGDDVFIQWHGAATSEFLDSLVINPTEFIFEAKGKITTKDPTTQAVYWAAANASLSSPDDAIWLDSYNKGNNRRFYSANETTYTGVTASPDFVLNQWYDLKIVKQASTASGYVDDVQVGTAITTNLPNETLGLHFWEGGTNQGEQAWSFVRKYTPVEPTATVGTEEHQRRVSQII